MGVELHHPVPHDLNRDPAEPGCCGAGCPLIDRGQGQQTPGLRAVLGRAGDRAQRMGIKVCPERNRHGEPPSFATLNQTCLKPTRPNRVTPSGTWYYSAIGHDPCPPGCHEPPRRWPIPVRALQGATSYWACVMANSSGHMSHHGAQGTEWTLVAPNELARLASLHPVATRRLPRVQEGSRPRPSPNTTQSPGS